MTSLTSDTTITVTGVALLFLCVVMNLVSRRVNKDDESMRGMAIYSEVVFLIVFINVLTIVY